MVPEITEQKNSELPISDESEMLEVLLPKSDFDYMMDVLENPPEIPEYLIGAAAWYNDVTK